MASVGANTLVIRVWHNAESVRRPSGMKDAAYTLALNFEAFHFIA